MSNPTRAKRAAPVREQIRKMHFEQGLSPRQIALIRGTSTANVYEHLEKLRHEAEAEKDEAS